jgi:hypothetical protein
MKNVSLIKKCGIIVTVIILQLIFTANSFSQCAAPMRDGDFETQRNRTISSPWTAEGTISVERNQAESQRGRIHILARNINGWNAIRQTVRLYEGKTYTLKGYIKSSVNVTDGYFGFRGANQRPVSEIKFGSSGNYRQLSVSFKPTSTGNYNIFAGFWAPNADSWIRIDNITISFPCEDSVGNPV